MRLLNFTSDGEFSVTTFDDDSVPSYAVLSHTWGPEEEELTLKDIQDDAGKSKLGATGYHKIQFCGKQAACHGISYFWVDTCCIDKSSSAELTEAINSMFKWYHEAAKCFAYLSDVSTVGCEASFDTSQPNFESEFRKSRWFTRGWTLQELVAPSSVEFFSREGKLLGDKISLKRQIHEITGIPVKAIQGSPLSQFTVEERLSWAAKRTTKRKEDEAYCLLGIFDISMPLLYGEGKDKAFIRLQEAIDRPIKSLLSQLPCAVDASFNTYSKQYDPTCLPDTRVDLLREIYTWADGKDGRFIYWLNGLAGTGKSTIARTVARKYFDNGQLAASFFFSRGGGDVGHASKFFTTIAVQLARKSYPLQQHICDALRKNADIATQSLSDQWRQVVLGPLSKLSGDPYPSSYILVIDALDECDNHEDIGTILKLFAEAQTLQPVRLRVLLTSRPEIPIRHGFSEISETGRQDFVLHHISPLIVDHDITIFLKYNLGLICQKKPSLGASWPGEETVKKLVQSASGLFIWAATACRFIQDAKSVSLIRKRLAAILPGSCSIAEERPEKHLNDIYTTVLRHSIPANYSTEEKDEFLCMLRDILGSIVTLLTPLSVHSLSRLLNLQSEELDDGLEDLHAILDIPQNRTCLLRLHHPSFRDFLLNIDRCNDLNFWVDEKQANKTLAARCMQLMSTSLKEDICDVTIPGTLVAEIESCRVEQGLPLEVQYACLHWVQHLRNSDAQLRDNDQVHKFLQKHLLHWLEALGWMRKISEGILEIISLESISSVASCHDLYGLIHDMKRFALHNRVGIEQAPLQVYHGALFLTPAKSIVRRQFIHKMPRWIMRGPKVDESWSATLQTLEGHLGWVRAIAFSPDGKQLASGSHDRTIRIWNAATGATLQTLAGHSSLVKAVVFSPNGKQLASSSYDKTVRIWDPATGATLQTLEGHSGSVTAIAFSLDGKQLASGSRDRSVQIWDASTGTTLQTLNGHSDWDIAVTFSPDGKHLASGSNDWMIGIWDVATGTILQTLEGHSSKVEAIAFSPDGKQLVSGSTDRTVRIWDAATGRTLQTLEGHSDSVYAVAFSHDGKQLAVGSRDRTLQIWDVATRTALRTFEGHSDSVNSVAFSPNGKQLASGSNDRTVRIGDADADTATAVTLRTTEGHSCWVNAVTFSPDGKQLASGSDDRTVRIWDAAKGISLQTLEGHSDLINTVAFSPNGKWLASGSHDKTVRIWDAATGAILQTLEGHSDSVLAVAFSSDCKQLASGSYDETVRIWDTLPMATFIESCQTTLMESLWSFPVQTVAGATLLTLLGHSSWVNAVAFSPDGKQLASGSDDGRVRIWDAVSGAPLHILMGWDTITRLCYSSDGSIVTNHGRLDLTSLNDKMALHSNTPLYTSLHSLIAQSVASTPDIYVQNDWIGYGKDRMLWLPPEYRYSSSAVYENIVCLGYRSGRVAIFEFSFDL